MALLNHALKHATDGFIGKKYALKKYNTNSFYIQEANISLYWWKKELVIDLPILPQFIFLSLFLGILDMFGFEDSKPSQLEQLCINLCSETMQHFYNTHIFKSSIESCREEGITYDVSIDYVDNVPCIDLISSLVSWNFFISHYFNFRSAFLKRFL